MQPLYFARRHCRKLYSNQRGHCPHLFGCREESPPLGRGFCNKIYGGYLKGGENVLPENIPEREWHCHAAQHQIGDGEAHDEVVPRRPHYRLAQDGVLCGVGKERLNQIWAHFEKGPLMFLFYLLEAGL